jgi:hypothetical protein
VKLIDKIDSRITHYIGPLRFEHDGIPTYEECRQLIRDTAFFMSERSEGRQEDFWLQAEKVLFWQQENHFLYGGYRIYVRDKTKPKAQDFYDHWDLVIVSPAGPVYVK